MRREDNKIIYEYFNLTEEEYERIVEISGIVFSEFIKKADIPGASVKRFIELIDGFDNTSLKIIAFVFMVIGYKAMLETNGAFIGEDPQEFALIENKYRN